MNTKIFEAVKGSDLFKPVSDEEVSAKKKKRDDLIQKWLSGDHPYDKAAAQTAKYIEEFIEESDLKTLKDSIEVSSVVEHPIFKNEIMKDKDKDNPNLRSDDDLADDLADELAVFLCGQAGIPTGISEVVLATAIEIMALDERTYEPFV